MLDYRGRASSCRTHRTVGDVIGHVVCEAAVVDLAVDVRVEVPAKTEMVDPSTYGHTCENTVRAVPLPGNT